MSHAVYTDRILFLENHGQRGTARHFGKAKLNYANNSFQIYTFTRDAICKHTETNIGYILNAYEE